MDDRQRQLALLDCDRKLRGVRVLSERLALHLHAKGAEQPLTVADALAMLTLLIDGAMATSTALQLLEPGMYAALAEDPITD